MKYLEYILSHYMPLKSSILLLTDALASSTMNDGCSGSEESDSGGIFSSPVLLLLHLSPQRMHVYTTSSGQCSKSSAEGMICPATTSLAIAHLHHRVVGCNQKYKPDSSSSSFSSVLVPASIHLSVIQLLHCDHSDANGSYYSYLLSLMTKVRSRTSGHYVSKSLLKLLLCGA